MEAAADQVAEMLYHRGPDHQDKTGFPSGLELHHTRLSIVDLEQGQQPMKKGPYTIIFNGEIYNHLELRTQHKLNGKSHSDTETLLLLYEKFGLDMLDMLDGMFAMAIYNEAEQKLLLVRDRAAQKPLYYYHRDGAFTFSSELNVLQKAVNDEVDDQRISRYVNRGFFFQEQTPFKNIDELPGGHLAVYDISNDDLTIRQWWNIEDFYDHKISFNYDQAKEVVFDKLNTSVKRRLLSSDVEVGAFLSGGIDSGLVVALASKYTDQLKTFTVRFSGQFDESKLAEEVAQHYGTDHKIIDISFDHLDEDIEKIFTSYGEPFMDDSIIPSFYVSKAARENVPVILNGDGGDEMFGGYRRYIPFQLVNFLKQRKLWLPFINGQYGRRDIRSLLSRLVHTSRLQPAEAYLSSTCDVFLRPEVSEDKYFRFVKEMSEKPWHGVDKMLCLDFNIILPSILLKKMDIATMQCSLEGRSPFLGKEILELAPSLLPEYKVHLKNTKRVLRDLSKNLLPDSIHHQPKRGFEIPLEHWVDGILRERIRDTINDPNAFCHQFYKSNTLGRILNRRYPDMSDYKRAKILFMVLGLEIWYKSVNAWQIH